MSILSSTNSGRFGLRIHTRNYFIEVARDCLPLKSANLAFIPGQTDYELFAQNTLDIEQRGTQFVLVANLEDFDVFQTVFKHEQYCWFEFSSVYKKLDTAMLTRISKIMAKFRSGKELLVNPLYKKIDFTNERKPFVDEVQNGMRFSGVL